MPFSDSLRNLLSTHQQEHLLQFEDQLSSEQQTAFAKQIESIDFELLDRLLAQRDRVDGAHESGSAKAERAISPEQLIRLDRDGSNSTATDEANQLGAELLQAGKVGAILVAGGQGSRLGFDLPKGMFPIGPVSERTLFQVLCEQLLARSRRAGVAIPYFIMTSEATHDETVEFFTANQFFGLSADDVFFFQQASLPAVADDSRRILLAEPGRIATSPDGHGGMLRALEKHGMLDVMRERKIEHLFYHQVDNPTAIVCDPELLGHHLKSESQLTTRVVAKVSPQEKMGVLVSIDGVTQIIEYSDLPEAQAVRKDADGNNVFWAGNTAVHIFQREFIESLLTEEKSLPFHIAHKKVPCLNEDGITISPETPNANKFEQFIFDALLNATTALVVEGDRSREFNPVKNADGNDSPKTSRAALNTIAREWVHASGGTVHDGVQIEISPLTALDVDELSAKLAANTTFDRDTIL